MDDEILTTKQVAEQWPILTASTLRYWRHAGIGPASFTLAGKKVVYRRSEIERWLAEQEAQSLRGGVAS